MSSSGLTREPVSINTEEQRIKIFFRRNYDRARKTKARSQNRRKASLLFFLILVIVVVLAYRLNAGDISLFAKGLSPMDWQNNALGKQAADGRETTLTPTTMQSREITPVAIALGAVTPPANDPKVLELLKGFVLPLKGATLPTFDGQLPNAQREYRSGTHEGIDFYNGAVGVPVKLGTQVIAAKSGVVIRADNDYQEASEAQINEWLDLTRRLGYTPKEILDLLRGRQVWIDHGNNIISRYVHLLGIAPGIAPGVRVDTGQLIAYVGNSGSPEAAEGTNNDVHLHFEIWIGDQYLGQGLSSVQVKDWLKRVFSK